jgi:glycosyltransferase involved in cell wall biosynthesis
MNESFTTQKTSPGRDRTNVVFFQTASESFGGGSKMLLRLIKDLDKDHFEITVLSQFEDELCRRLNPQDAEVTVIPYRGALDVYEKQLLTQPIHKKIASVGRLLQFNVEARNTLSDADVIWCDCLRSVLTIAPHKLLSSTPVIWNIGLGYESSGVRRILNSIGLKAADHVFIESKQQAQSVFTDRQYDSNRQKFTIFHKGIDTSKFTPRDRSSDEKLLHVGTAASITPRKGHEYFIDAASRLLTNHDDVQFSIAGDVTGPDDHKYKQELKARIEREEIGDRIQFHGWIEDMPTYLAELDVFVLPSLNEGIPGAVREALSAGVPVVATDVGGTADVVIDRKTGYLVEPKNSAELAAAIEPLLKDQDKRHRMGTAGREQIVEQFSIEQYIRKYEEFLSGVV